MEPIITGSVTVPSLAAICFARRVQIKSTTRLECIFPQEAIGSGNEALFLTGS